MYLCTQIQCIGADCNASMHRDEILARLSGADKARYAQFLIDANCDPLRRTCPRCSHVLAVDAGVLSTADRYGLMVTCAECQLDWCFQCHAPWHARMKCSEFLRGDKLLKAWAREQHYGQVNAQKCPKCKVTRRAYIATFTCVSYTAIMDLCTHIRLVPLPKLLHLHCLSTNGVILTSFYTKSTAYVWKL